MMSGPDRVSVWAANTAEFGIGVQPSMRASSMTIRLQCLLGQQARSRQINDIRGGHRDLGR
jgi:hypothetical protein